MRSASRLIVLTVGLLTLGGRLATAQTFKIRSCHRPKVPIGVMDASGLVRFQVARDGRPAPGTVAAIAAKGSSLAGFQSAAERQLSACRFDTGKLKREFPLTVESRFTFDSLKVWLSDPVVTLDQRAPVPVALEPPPEPGPYPADMRLVDERPRQEGCQVVSGTPRYPTGSSVQDLMLTTSLTQSNRIGSAVVQYEVKPDGRVEKGSIKVLRASSNLVRDQVARSIAKCRFAPGRIGGAPVAVTTTQLLWLH